jgi:hypothetical protein
LSVLGIWANEKTKKGEEKKMMYPQPIDVKHTKVANELQVGTSL